MKISISLWCIICFSYGCVGQSVKTFPINKQYTSKNYNSRIRQIVLHYTAIEFEGSLNTLDGKTSRQVSSHYLINDKPTAKNKDYIYQLVPENKRSWHAGVSYWRGDDDLNNSSIGIEITNVNGNATPYPEEQIQAVIYLVKQLIAKYDVAPINIIGHSDIAPARKIDPGKKFPWETLYKHQIGAWYDKKDINRYTNSITKLPAPLQIKSYLHHLGYDISLNSPHADQEYKRVVESFQRHYAPQKVDGNMSLDNYIVLRALVHKYNNID